MSLANFNSYKTTFNSMLENIISQYTTSEKVKEMIMYSLEDGKRLRPIIALDICLKKGKCIDDIILFAVAIELLHTASLIIDDLPCMDNDDFRRNRLSFHKKYSEYDAQLITNKIMNISTKLVFDNFKQKNNSSLTIIMNNISKNMGILGAAGGQLMDLTPVTSIYNNKQQIITEFKNKEKLKELFTKKTTSFFEIAFIGGYISGDGDINNLDDIIQAAYNFGLAFQIYDDFDDIDQDKQRINKDLQDPNFINNFGKQEAYNEFEKSIETFKNIMTKHELYSTTIYELVKFLESKVKNKI